MIHNKKVVIGVVGALVIGIAILFFGFHDDDNLPASQQSYVITATSTTPQSNQQSATITYNVPAPEQNTITVKLTVADGIVTAANVNNVTNSPQSEQYSSRFLASYKSEVIGKKLNDISLSRVGGASLTSQAFNAAVEAIKAQV